MQGSALTRRSLCRKFSHSCLSSATLPKPFLQVHYIPRTLIDRKSSANVLSKAYRATISAEAGKQGWDIGRFIKTLYFFNGPPSPAKVCQTF